jgi:Methylamine utilisation protein MauE
MGTGVDVILATDLARSVAGLFLAACALLVIAGAGKVVHPAPARRAARAAGLRVSRSGIVGFGFVEIGAGVVGALVGGRAALAVAGCYLVLTAVAIVMLIRAPTTPCACLGSSNAVVTRTHVAINVCAAGIALVTATGGSPVGEVTDHWLSTVVLGVLVVCCVKLAMLALEVLPEVVNAIQEGST